LSDDDASADDTLTNIEKALRAESRRVTKQRVLLFRIIRDSEGHLDAHEIYRLARQKNPHLSLSTVYRTLNLLKEMGLIVELHFLEEEHHYYEFKDATEHYHLICSACGQIIEFKSPLIKQLREQVGRQNDFEIHRVEVDMSGLCAHCRRELENSSV
jgi:Fe2+ or Zn2+ uptake regulation protein